jgi:hypothetical protein
MKYHLLIAAAFVSACLAACGGGGGDGTPAAPATVASTTAATATTPAPSGQPPSACALVTRADASRAFGGRAHAGTGTGPSCVYRRGTQIISVQVQVATPAVASAMAGAFSKPDPRSTRVRAAGFEGLVTVLITPGQGGSQARIALIRGDTVLQILATDTRKTHARSLTGVVTRLGRSAARRA